MSFTEIFVNESKLKTPYVPSIVSFKSIIDNNYTFTKFMNMNEVNQYLETEINKFYGKFNGNTKGTDSYGKTMQQRYADLINMQLSFKELLSNTSKSYLGSDAMDLLKKKNELEKKKANIDISLNNLQKEDVKVKLDSTIYTTVLWTILVILLIYYVFIRL